MDSLITLRDTWNIARQRKLNKLQKDMSITREWNYNSKKDYNLSKFKNKKSLQPRGTNGELILCYFPYIIMKLKSLREGVGKNNDNL